MHTKCLQENTAKGVADFYLFDFFIVATGVNFGKSCFQYWFNGEVGKKKLAKLLLKIGKVAFWSFTTVKGRQWLSSGPGSALFLKGIRCGAKQGSISKNWIKVYEDNCPVAPVLPLEHSPSCDFHCKHVLIRNSLKRWLTTEKSQLCIQMTATNLILQNFITDNEGINGQLTTVETKKK